MPKTRKFCRRSRFLTKNAEASTIEELQQWFSLNDMSEEGSITLDDAQTLGLIPRGPLMSKVSPHPDRTIPNELLNGYLATDLWTVTSFWMKQMGFLGYSAQGPEGESLHQFVNPRMLLIFNSADSGGKGSN